MLVGLCYSSRACTISTTLFESIQRLLQLPNLVEIGRRLVSFGHIHVNLLLDRCMEERCLDIHLLEVQITMGSYLDKSTNGLHSSGWRKGFMIVNTFNLRKALGYETSFNVGLSGLPFKL